MRIYCCFWWPRLPQPCWQTRPHSKMVASKLVLVAPFIHAAAVAACLT